MLMLYLYATQYAETLLSILTYYFAKVTKL